MRSLGLLALLVLTACGSGPAEDALPTDSVKPFEVRENAAAKRVDENAEASTVATFALMPDGLTVTHGSAKGRPVNLLRFGDGKAETIAALTRELRAPTESENSECDAGPMQFADFGAIKASFQKGKFVGWVAERGKGLKAGEGISPDKPFRFLEKIGARMVPKSTLDGEFVLEGSGTGSSMGGLAEEGERVQMLFAGSNCFYR